MPVDELRRTTSRSAAENTLNVNGNDEAVPLPTNGPAIRVVLLIVIGASPRVSAYESWVRLRVLTLHSGERCGDRADARDFAFDHRLDAVDGAVHLRARQAS